MKKFSRATLPSSRNFYSLCLPEKRVLITVTTPCAPAWGFFFFPAYTFYFRPAHRFCYLCYNSFLEKHLLPTTVFVAAYMKQLSFEIHIFKYSKHLSTLERLFANLFFMIVIQNRLLLSRCYAYLYF